MNKEKSTLKGMGLILTGIKENSKNDKTIHMFLSELVFEEAEHPGQWRWKDNYRKTMERYSEEWEQSDED
ncbi:MAG: hypothetical protein ACYTEL_18810 [Planctomycetota bacterium]|jgi:hypothetical protein